jgi:uncharacterized membrane protein
MWQKIGKYYPPQLELIALFLLALTFYLVFSSYTTLPESIPTHFNLQGLPDDWGSRNELFIFPAISIFIYALLTIVSLIMANAKDPRRYINLPINKTAMLSEDQMERLRELLTRGIFALKLIVQLLVSFLSFTTIEIARGNSSQMGDFWYFFLAAIFIIVFYMIWKSFRITGKSPSPR